MSLHEDIPMTSDLLEKLLTSSLQQEYKSKLFSAYAEEYMTKKIAMQMHTLHMPVTKGVFAEAWTCVDEGEQEQLLLENCTVLDAVELAQKFKEMGGNYKALADRTRRHEVNLFATPQRIQLAKHLQTIGYITSWEEKEEKAFDPAVEKETSRKLLKLRIRQIKQPN